MSIFAVIQQNARGEAGTLEVAVRTSGHPSYPVQADVWLIMFPGTAQALCDELGITPEGSNGTAVVLEVSSYYGRANPAIWSWLKQNWQGTLLG